MICACQTTSKRCTADANEHPESGMVFANGSYLGGPAHDRETIIPAAKSCRLAEQGVPAGRPFRQEHRTIAGRADLEALPTTMSG